MTTHRHVALVVLAAVAALLAPGAASAAEEPASSDTPGAGSCASSLDATEARYEQVSPGVLIQDFATTDVTGGIAGLPDRVITDLSPGQSGTICIGFHNRTGKSVSLQFDTHDFGTSRNGSPVPYATGERKHGAGTWLKLPTQAPVSLEHGELAWLDVAVSVPLDTAGGSAYAGVSASPVDQLMVQLGATQGNMTRISPAVVVQVFFDVPGDITQGGEIEDARAPRVVWWDGLDIARIPFLEKLRGQGIAPVRFDWKNTGSLTDEIGGIVRIESSLGGKDVAKLPISDLVVLRDSTRGFETTWSNDIPFIGRFTPTIEVTDSAGTVHTKELDPIWVIPSWWYFVALIIAIGVPLWLRRRNQRRYDELLARVEAAEARGDEDDGDEYSDDGWR